MSIIDIIGLMTLAGLSGGTINYALARTSEFSGTDLFWSIVVGLGASFLVPLFLNTISSSLLSRILANEAPTSDVFVYFGFCLLGAIASKSMIRSLTQKALNLAEKTKKDLADLEKEVEPIIVKETEPQVQGARIGPVTASGYGLVGDEAPEVIKALGSSRYSRRTVSGITQDSKVPRERVVETLNWLATNSLANTTSGRNKQYWSLTEKGYEAFQELVHEGLN